MRSWSHKDEWRTRGENFLVIVSRHEVELSKHMPELDINRWCVYAYIYPAHPLFSTFKVDGGMFQEATSEMPLHKGPTLFEVHRGPDGAVGSVQVGADYNHIYDDHYTYYLTKEQARSVFNDAEELCNWLTERGKQ